MQLIPILGYNAATYEAIIAGLVIVGLTQAFVLRRRAKHIQAINSAVAKFGKAALSGVFALTMKSAVEIARANRRAAVAEQEAQRLAQELQASDETNEIDEGNGGIRTTDSEFDPFNAIFGRMPGVPTSPLDAFFAARSGRPTARDLFRRADRGTFNRDPYADLADVIRGEPVAPGVRLSCPSPTGVPFSFDDIRAALTGDVSAIEQRLGAPPGSVKVAVLGDDGRPASAAERASILAILSRGEHNETETESETEPKSDVTTINEVGHGLEGHDAEACATQQAPLTPAVPRYERDRTDFAHQSPRAG